MTQIERLHRAVAATGPLAPSEDQSGTWIELPGGLRLIINVPLGLSVDVPTVDSRDGRPTTQAITLQFDRHRLVLTVTDPPGLTVPGIPAVHAYLDRMAQSISDSLTQYHRFPVRSPLPPGHDDLLPALRSPDLAPQFPATSDRARRRNRALVAVNQALDTVDQAPDQQTASADDLGKPLILGRASGPARLGPLDPRLIRLFDWVADLPRPQTQDLTLVYDLDGDMVQVLAEQEMPPQILWPGQRVIRTSDGVTVPPPSASPAAGGVVGLARQRLTQYARAMEAAWPGDRPSFRALLVLRHGERETRFMLSITRAAWPLAFSDWLAGREVDPDQIGLHHDFIGPEDLAEDTPEPG